MNSQKTTRVLAGTLAGWSIVTVGQPLDYMKTMYQVAHHLPSFKEIYRDIGILGFYRGASSIYLFAGLVTALQFETFQRSTKKLMELGFKDGQQPSVLCLMLSGFMTGFVCSFVYTPTQYAKIHSQIGSKSTSLGSAAMIFQVLKREKFQGLKKLYTGHSITLIKQSLGSSVYYGGYYITLTKVFNQKREQAKVWTQIISGGLAGVLYQLYSYPVDTIKTNVQSGKKSLTEMLGSKFWSTNNFKNGLKISLLRSFIVDATNFTVYENMRKFLLRGYDRMAKGE